MARESARVPGPENVPLPRATRPEGRPPAVRREGFLPIGDYAVLGDGRSCALVGSDGAVDWWALPRMDSPPVFGALLDPERGGSWTLAPASPTEVSRCYADDGGVLVTTYRTPEGTVRITDAITLGAGSLLPWGELARRVEALDGTVRLRWSLSPGDRFSGAAPWTQVVDGRRLVHAGGQQMALVLDGAGDPEQLPGGYAGEFTVSPERPALLALVATTGEPTPVPAAEAIVRRIAETTEHWSRWRQLVDYDGPWRDAVVRSALVHKQLTVASTGALQAAATTSLPERIGGTRNFDYRYSWVRDTAFALGALTSLDLRGEVHATTSYLLRSVAATAPDVHVFYTMDGRAGSGDMAQVPLWRGYRGSAPVHVGNSAALQRQLGSYGDLLGAVCHYVDHGNVLDPGTGRLVAQVADQVCDQWGEDDAGLWELGQRRPYTSSKIGCWAALDRTLRLADLGQVPDAHADRWREARQRIRDYVDTSCWSPARNSYTFYAGTDDLDCATLLVARTGFCSGNDPRLHGTIDEIRSSLSAGGPLLYRYTGMQDQEGAFVACTFWLVEALTVAGRLAEAREVMDAMVARANDVGLLSEEIDPDSGELLGNIPQALSHLALINAAVRLHRAQGGG